MSEEHIAVVAVRGIVAERDVLARELDEHKKTIGKMVKEYSELEIELLAANKQVRELAARQCDCLPVVQERLDASIKAHNEIFEALKRSEAERDALRTQLTSAENRWKLAMKRLEELGELSTQKMAERVQKLLDSLSKE